MTRGLGRLAVRIGSGVFCLVLEIVTGGGGTRFLLSIGATLIIASFALVPEVSLLFRPAFFVARFIFCLSLPAVGMVSETRAFSASPKVPESFKSPSCSTFYAQHEPLVELVAFLGCVSGPPVAGAGCLYLLTCREHLFSEAVLPALIILGSLRI